MQHRAFVLSVQLSPEARGIACPYLQQLCRRFRREMRSIQVPSKARWYIHRWNPSPNDSLYQSETNGWYSKATSLLLMLFTVGAVRLRPWNMPGGRKNELSLMNRKMPASYHYVVCRLLLFILSVILRGFLLCQRDMRTMFLYNKPKNEILI